MQPTEVNTRNFLDGRISLHFENYQVASAPIQARNDHHDNEDEERAHTIAVLVQDEEEEVLYFKCLTSTVVPPQRKTEGATGYDLAVSQNYHIPPYGQVMLNTGISIKTPKEGECIAQLILECCKTPPTIQVHDLDKTKRQAKGFGSTSHQYPCSIDKANPRCEGCPNCDDSTESTTPFDYYVTPHPSYIDDREYIEYQPPEAEMQRKGAGAIKKDKALTGKMPYQLSQKPD
ncbi:hypothetical protein ZIOFF_051200 [Zingiber officinale]|uniref:dUTP diphosphatase n=1 Tax=Zingiber officinale TaxID=94328 RepID=A0A8J5KQV7_ZINOF|nr:hypothetical protein ZIOFF_051200 [Zingiber officinale]